MMQSAKRMLIGSLALVAVLAAGCGGMNQNEKLQRETRGGREPAPASAPVSGSPSVPADTPATGPVTLPAPNPDTPVSSPPAPQPDKPAVQPLSFATLQRGASSGVTEQQVVLVTGTDDWQTQWQTHASRQVPVPAAPAVDFSKESIVAAYMGEKNSGGYSVEITDVTLDGGRMLVKVRQTAPGPGAIVTMALTQPYHMVRIPKVPAGTRVEAVWQ